MLIGIDASRALRPQRTGTEHYSLQVIRYLLSIAPHHRFRLYCHQPPPGDLFWADDQQAAPAADRAEPELRVIPFPRLWTHVRLSAEVMRRPPDVFFVPAHTLPLVHPRASVVTVHDLGYRYFPEAHRRADRWYLDLTTRFSAATAAHVLADSQATRQDLVRWYGLDPGRITVVYLGRDERLKPVFDPGARAAVLQRLGIGDGRPDPPFVLYVGTLQPRKNLERLIEAFARILPAVEAAWPGLQLVLAGRVGWLADGILRRVDALGLQSRVRFPGFVADADLPALLSAALVFAFPSLHEGFGFPVLEAQACGVPVLTSSTSSLPEVAGDGALLVDPLDVDAIAAGLQRLLLDAELRTSLAAAGQENLKRFSWQRCAQETLAVLEAVGSDHRRSEGR